MLIKCVIEITQSFKTACHFCLVFYLNQAKITCGFEVLCDFYDNEPCW